MGFARTGQLTGGYKPDPQIYVELIEECVSLQKEGEFSTCFTELQRNFLKQRPPKLKSLIRLVKHWYQNVWPSYQAWQVLSPLGVERGLEEQRKKGVKERGGEVVEGNRGRERGEKGKRGGEVEGGGCNRRENEREGREEGRNFGVLFTAISPELKTAWCIIGVNNC